MFTDIDGFTAISKEIGAEQAYAIVTRCLKLLDAIARKHGGSVDKYLGDAIMAVFGYPVPLDNAARAAATAAIEMRRCVHDYSRQLGLDSPLDVRIGVNTGELVAADVRGPVIREFHVLGDAVNVAARLKARAPLGSIFVGPETHDATKAKPTRSARRRSLSLRWWGERRSARVSSKRWRGWPRAAVESAS
jgi:adenylate cyclase